MADSKFTLVTLDLNNSTKYYVFSEEELVEYEEFIVKRKLLAEDEVEDIARIVDEHNSSLSIIEEFFEED